MDKIIDPDLDRVKQEIKILYKPDDYEALIEFSAKYFISDSRRRIEMDNFHQAMLILEFARADHNKETEQWVTETFKNNSLFESFTHVESYSTKFPRWYMQKKRHAIDWKAEVLALGWWKDDKKKGRNKVDVIEEYKNRLYDHGLYPIGNNKSKLEQRHPDEDKKYSDTTISLWLTNK